MDPSIDSSLALFPATLPTYETALVGRDGDLAAVIERLTTSRLVSIVGAAGVGKSHLAVEVARHWPTAALFVPLVTAERAEQVLASVVQRAGWATPIADSPLSTIVDHLADGEVLLVLDNVEHLLDAASDVVALLDACPGIRVLITTQIALRVAAESVVELQPLLPNAAVDLLVNVARLAEPAFRVDADNADALNEICVQLDGLPLALELAGARLRMVAPIEMVGLLDQRLDVLRRRRSGLNPHQQTLRAAIDWSYGLLDGAAQRHFTALSTFVGGFSLDAAATVTGTDVGEVLDVVEQLVDHQLIHIVRRDADVVRFDLLDTLRVYGSERLRADGREAEVRARHAAWFAGFVDRLYPSTVGPGAGHTLDALERELGNLRIAIGWLIEADPTDDTALRMVTQLRRFWWIRAHGNEGQALIARALDGYTGPANAALAMAWEAAGDLFEEHGDLAGCEVAFDRALTLFEQLDDRAGMARCFNTLGLVCRHRGDLDGATELHRLALTISEELNDEHGCVIALDRLAGAAYFGGDLDTAAELWQQTLPHIRASGDDRSMGLMLGNLGAVMVARGEPRRALAAHMEALRIQENQADRPAIGRTLINIGECHLALGELDEAEDRLQAGLEIARAKSDRYPMAEALFLLAQVAKRRGRWRQAAGLLLDSYDTAVDAGQLGIVARCLSCVAVMTAEAGRLAEAATWFASAAEVGDEARLVGADAAERDHWQRVIVDQIDPSDMAAARVARPLSAEETRSALHVLATTFADGMAVAPIGEPPAAALRALGLSRREAEVTLLLVQRLTDHEIADELFIGVRTAGSHVSAVLRKLGVSSRREVGEAIAAHGISLS